MKKHSNLFVVIFLIVGCIIVFGGLGKSSRPKTILKRPSKSGYINWKKTANDLILDYQGKIRSIEQLNGTTCWAVLSSNILEKQSIQIAENIGSYIKNVSGRTPTVHVFIDGKQVAMARPHGNQYDGRTEIEFWDPSSFNGEMRP